MSKTSSRSFLVPLLAIYALLLLAIGINLVVFWRVGEMVGIDEIVRLQRQDGAVYNGLKHSFADYKYAAYRQAEPEIVALGTSRAMQLRQTFFAAPFYNLGGLANGTGQANVVLDRLILREPPPRLVIFSLDYWTFCRLPGRSAPDRRAVEAETTHDGMAVPASYFLIYRLLLNSKISLLQLTEAVRSPDDAAEAGRVGLSARGGGSAFAADGSIYAPLPSPRLATRWRETLDMMALGQDKFIKDCEVSDLAIEALQRFTDKLEVAGSTVALLLAPLPGVVIERMHQDGRYGYVDILRRQLVTRFGDRFHDAFDLRGTAPDSEFIDGIHGGEIAYMRILLAAARRPGSGLQGLVDEAYLDRQISRWSGLTQSLDDPVHQRFFVAR